MKSFIFLLFLAGCNYTSLQRELDLSNAKVRELNAEVFHLKEENQSLIRYNNGLIIGNEAYRQNYFNLWENYNKLSNECNLNEAKKCEY